MSDYEAERRLVAVLRQGGWRYELATHGFCRGRDWVSWAQAEEALAAAELGEAQVIVPTSKSVARAVAGVTNDGE